MARKILLADDSVTAQNMGRKILADAGYDVATVNNGSAALKRITEVKPDLIVLDVYMPGYSGLEVCQRLKDAPETAHIPVLLTVGKLEPFKTDEARRVRADAHIVKPFEASELLTAITRLEDRMVPQADGSRFSTTVSGVERFGADRARAESDSDPDTGWKSRLRFPSKKKKEEPEPEPEDVSAIANFREYRRGKGKTSEPAPFTVKAPPPPGQEPGLVPDIPRDITPEELDALSALAAKLDGPIPESENVTPLADKMGPAGTAAVGEKKAQEKADDKKAEDAGVAAPAAAAVEAPATTAAKSETEPSSEVSAENAAPVAPPAAAEASAVESRGSEEAIAAAPVAETPAVSHEVSAASFQQESAPVDKSDEPIFASAQVGSAQGIVSPVDSPQTEAAQVVESQPAMEAKAEEKIVEKPVEFSVKSGIDDKGAQAVAAAEAPAAAATEAAADQLKAEEAPQRVPEESKTEKSEASVAAVTERKVSGSAGTRVDEPEAPAPSDEELAEALRLLTPATGQTSSATIPSHGTLVAAGQLLAEEAARTAMTPRWVAESVALTPEEAAISLEAEMFRTFATTPETALQAATEPARISTITAAVESRLAAVELKSELKTDLRTEMQPGLPAELETKTGSEQATERQVPTAVADSTVAESSAATTESPTAAAQVSVSVAPAIEANVESPTPPMPGSTFEQRSEPAEPGRADATQEKAERDSTDAETADEEVAAATFADVVGKEAIEGTEASEAAEVGAADASAGPEQGSISDAGGEESMSKDAKKSGKSNWHQIRNAPAGAGPNTDVVEAAKQAEQAAAESPKAMAAAASAEGSSSAPDAGTIASIVDSVMADLRPKIVEEIAKKLAGK